MNKEKLYTLVIKGDCPAVGADTEVFLFFGGTPLYAGIVDSVLFEGNALSINDVLENRVTELETALDKAIDSLDVSGNPHLDIVIEELRGIKEGKNGTN